MGKINLDKAIKEGRNLTGQNPAYDMRYLDMMTLARTAREGRPCDAVADAFSFGFLQGMKAERARRKEQNGFT